MTALRKMLLVCAAMALGTAGVASAQDGNGDGMDDVTGQPVGGGGEVAPGGDAVPPASDSSSASFAGQASLGGLLGVGVSLSSGGGTYLGLGARGGYTLPMNLYVGGAATLNVHLGEGSAYFLMVAGECGYDISAGPVIIRPYAGLGFAVAIVSVPDYVDPFTGMNVGGTQTDGRFLIKFGGELLVPIGTSLFVGGDTNISIIPGTGSTSFWSILGTFGARFGGPS